MYIKFKKLSESAISPQKANYNDAGFDLFADEDVTLAYGETAAVQTNIAIELPDGFMADVRPRSGLTLNSALRVHYGTIDAGYRGSIGIICENASHTDKMTSVCNMLHAHLVEQEEPVLVYNASIEIKRGDKIAQLVIQRIPDITFLEASNLTDSSRGANGFGSTDLKEETDSDDSDFGWYCETSPTLKCDYDNPVDGYDEDCCIYCGEPYERK